MAGCKMKGKGDRDISKYVDQVFIVKDMNKIWKLCLSEGKLW